MFGNTDDNEKDYVTVCTDPNGSLKMPLSANFGFAFPTELFDKEWFETCMAVESDLVD